MTRKLPGTPGKGAQSVLNLLPIRGLLKCIFIQTQGENGRQGLEDRSHGWANIRLRLGRHHLLCLDDEDKAA
jgi:hypothetical protein